jgi:hypothetical protein
LREFLLNVSLFFNVLIADISADHEEFLSTSVKLLQGIGISDQTKEIASSLGMKPDLLLSLLHSAGSILWEFAKGSPSDPSLVSITLRHLNVPDDLADQFANVW